MARRYSTRGISAARVYTYKQAARIVGVSEATFRKWPKRGLKVITDKRPFLVCGADLIAFLKKRKSSTSKPTTKTQCYCMRCGAQREVMGGAATYTAYSDLTGRFGGLCAVCGCKIGRFCSASGLAELATLLTITYKASAQAYVDPPPSTETHTSGHPVEPQFSQGGNAPISKAKKDPEHEKTRSTK